MNSKIQAMRFAMVQAYMTAQTEKQWQILMHRIHAFDATKIVVRVEMGVVEPVAIPLGVTLVVKDYDQDGTEEELLEEDPDGRKYHYDEYDHSDCK